MTKSGISVAVAIFVLVAVLLLSAGLLSRKPDSSAAERQTEQARALPPPAVKHRPKAAHSAPAVAKLIMSSPMTPMDERRVAIVQKFLHEPDAETRRYIVPELADLNDPQSVLQIIELLKTETDPQVRDNLIAFLGYMPYSTNYADEIIDAAAAIHANPLDDTDRMAVQRMAIELQHPRSVEFLRNVLYAADTLPEERIVAGEGLVRLHHEVGLVSREEAASIVDRMRLDAEAMTNPEQRAQAYRGLNVTRFENKEFFQRMLATETDADCRNVLSAYVAADPQPSPTRGPLRTPWPSPTAWAGQTPQATPAIAEGGSKPWVEPTPQIRDEPLTSQ